MAYLTCFFLLISAVSASAVAIRDIVIDPGHGGYDSGITAKGLKEKDLSFSIARELESALKAEYKRVLLTRNVDRYLSLKERILTSSGRQADFFLSIHASSTNRFAIYVSWYPEGEVSVRQYYLLHFRQRRYLDQSKELALVVAETIKKEFNVKVAIREMSLPLLGSIGAPAILMEVPLGGNYTVDRIVKAIVKGISTYEKR